MPDDRRQRRVATVLASLSGAIVAVLLAYRTSCRYECRALSYWLNYNTGDVLLWAMIGAFLTAAAFYCARVFWRP